MKFSSLTAPDIFKMKTSDAASDGNLVKMTFSSRMCSDNISHNLRAFDNIDRAPGCLNIDEYNVESSVVR